MGYTDGLYDSDRTVTAVMFAQFVFRCMFVYQTYGDLSKRDHWRQTVFHQNVNNSNFTERSLLYTMYLYSFHQAPRHHIAIFRKFSKPRDKDLA